MAAGTSSLPLRRPLGQPLVRAFFVRWANWMVRRQFHAVRIAQCGPPPRVDAAQPLVVFLNHASWWDPLMALWLAERFFPARAHSGPMEAAQLRRYGILRHIGIFGVEKGAAGARSFLRVCESVLAAPGSTLWLTPQGRFADVRERPARFAPGLAHLLERMPWVSCVSLAMEFSFGRERLPEVRLRFGRMRCASEFGAGGGVGVERVQSALEENLERNQDALARRVCEGNWEQFETLSLATSGTSLPYDVWRWMCQTLRGEQVELNHSGS